jgi:hypothetical protein
MSKVWCDGRDMTLSWGVAKVLSSSGLLNGRMGRLGCVRFGEGDEFWDDGEPGANDILVGEAGADMVREADKVRERRTR